MHSSAVKGLVCAALVGLIQCRAGAPQRPSSLIIRGTVLDSVNSEPLQAYVRLGGQKDGVFADSTGAFELRAYQPLDSDHVLEVRRIGYVVRQLRIAVGSDSTYEVGQIRLRPTKIQLDDLIVDTLSRPSH